MIVRFSHIRAAVALFFAISLCSGIPSLSLAASGDTEITGFVGIEYRAFQHAASFPGQRRDSLSAVAQLELFHQRPDGKNSFLFIPYARIDEYDEKRTHFDIRELQWTHVGEDWELLAGISKVFWGVTESVHLVDIINQTDMVDRFDTEAKLGQPMIKYTLVKDWGDLSFFVLPGFRERTFQSDEGRLRTPFPVAERTEYASSAEQSHVDFAIRYVGTFGDIDVGLSHFSGTSREPRLRPGLNEDGMPVLIPRYDTIDQTGLDLQATKDEWLYKLELITRSGFGDRYTAAVAGFEYTFTGVMKSNADLGVLFEYLYDDRNESATTFFEDDVFLGARLALNDAASTELLFGVIFDVDSSERIYSVEGNRRIGENMKLEIEARLFSNVGITEQLTSLRNDDFVQMSLNYFY